MSRFAYWNRLLAGIAVGCVAAALTLHIESVAVLSSSQFVETLQFFGRVLTVPGILLAMTFSRNAHGFNLWLAALYNAAFWLANCWLLGALVALLQEKRRYSAWDLREDAAETTPWLEAGRITGLQDECTKRWHSGAGRETARSGNEWLAAMERQHRANFDLWHVEDEARRPGATDAEVADVKRRVDKTNQLRNDLAEGLDRKLLEWLEAKGLPNAAAPLNSESPGLIVDRLSILALRIYHTREETCREDAPRGHAERNCERLEILEAQRADLAGCLDDLWKETLAGRRRFKQYRQLKMYNDPTLNPAIYGELRKEEKV
ncbi:MAG: DUF4254 domain-containing protein [Terracidiphilus sp.]